MHTYIGRYKIEERQKQEQQFPPVMPERYATVLYCPRPRQDIAWHIYRVASDSSWKGKLSYSSWKERLLHFPPNSTWDCWPRDLGWCGWMIAIVGLQPIGCCFWDCWITKKVYRFVWKLWDVVVVVNQLSELSILSTNKTEYSITWQK